MTGRSSGDGYQGSSTQPKIRATETIDRLSWYFCVTVGAQLFPPKFIQTWDSSISVMHTG